MSLSTSGLGEHNFSILQFKSNFLWLRPYPSILNPIILIVHINSIIYSPHFYRLVYVKMHYQSLFAIPRKGLIPINPNRRGKTTKSLNNANITPLVPEKFFSPAKSRTYSHAFLRFNTGISKATYGKPDLSNHANSKQAVYAPCTCLLNSRLQKLTTLIVSKRTRSCQPY